MLNTFSVTDLRVCRSTSGGAIPWGALCLKAWSSTWAVVAVSSREVVPHALTKEATQTLGARSLLADFGVSARSTFHTNRGAAIGVVQRAGLEKLRRINVRCLPLKHKVKNNELHVKRVLGRNNPTDLMTKHVGVHDLQNHPQKAGMELSISRANIAPAWS